MCSIWPGYLRVCGRKRVVPVATCPEFQESITIRVQSVSTVVCHNEAKDVTAFMLRKCIYFVLPKDEHQPWQKRPDVKSLKACHEILNFKLIKRSVPNSIIGTGRNQCHQLGTTFDFDYNFNYKKGTNSGATISSQYPTWPRYPNPNIVSIPYSINHFTPQSYLDFRNRYRKQLFQAQLFPETCTSINDDKSLTSRNGAKPRAVVSFLIESSFSIKVGPLGSLISS